MSIIEALFFKINNAGLCLESSTVFLHLTCQIIGLLVLLEITFLENSLMTKKDLLASMTPDKAIQELLDGNLRYCTNKGKERDLMKEVESTSSGQFPFAIVLGCIDSRVPVELLFDQGIGDLFVARVAGNFENDDIIASMEYACEVVGSKVIMVLGHESCGAVKAACDNVEMGHITALLDRIKPAISNATFKGEVSSKNKVCVDEVAKTNVGLTIQRIKEKSAILNKLEKEANIKIVGAFYHLQSGEVHLL